MDNENNVYPDFVPNQVLTNNQLNQLREYLDQQNRLGRVRLTGTGIICGLNVRLENNKVIISDGFGISSEGYLIELDNKKKTDSTFSHWKKYTDPNLHEDGTIAYDNWQKAGNKKAQRDILELTSSAATGAKKLTALQFKGRVLVLYLEQNNEQLDSCLVTDCDSKGVNVRFSVRVLLVKKDALQAVESCKSAKGKLIHIPRLHTKLPLASVEKAAQINEAYNTIIENQFEEVLITINQSYEKYAAILSLDEDIPELLKNLEIIVKEPSQYSWDILNDIADAYNEFTGLACQLLSPCFAEQDFPRHLMLGSLEADEASYRHPFFPSAIRNVEHDELERVRKLFLRILVLASSINLEKSDEIAITPSHTTLYPLGKRALPFYYAPDIEPYWQPHMCCTTEEVWSYHFQKKLSEFDYASASFLRIEGHIGKDCDEATKLIRELQQKLNLEFDLLALSIKSEKEKESLVSLAQDIPGIEHTAGVVKGGTFILLCDAEKNKVVADFSLTGQIPCCRYFQPPEQPVELGSISGQFTDENGGAFPGGKVVLKRPDNSESTDITDNKARYRFANLRAGAYTLQASINKGQNEDFVSQSKRVQLAAGEDKTVNLVGIFVTTEKGIIKGNVMAESPTGARPTPVPDAQVVLKPGNKKQQTGRKGAFQFKDLDPDTYTLQASIKFTTGAGAIKRSTDPVTVKLSSGETETANLLFKETNEKTGNLDVVLIDSRSNKPISKASVSIRHASDRRATASLDKPTNARTKHFLFSGIKTGKYSISVKASGYKAASQNSTVSTNKTASASIKLTKSTSIDRPITPGPGVVDIGRPITDRRRPGGGFIPIRADQPDSSADLTAKEIYGQRIASYQALLSEIPAPVKRSAVAKLAHAFVHETIVNETADDVISKQYNQLVSQGLKTLANSNTSTANRAHYKNILSITSLALLDSLMMSSPETLGVDAETAVRKVKLTLNKAGIPLAGFKKQWNAKQLKDELEVSSASKVTAILR